MKGSLLFAGAMLACAVMNARVAMAAPGAAAKAVVIEIKNATGRSVGTATLTDANPGVRIRLDVRSLPPGEHSIRLSGMSMEPVLHRPEIFRILRWL